MDKDNSSKNKNADLYKYAGLATQLMVALAAGIFTGLKFDKWLSFSIPLMVWLLPLLILAGITWQIIKDTTKK